MDKADALRRLKERYLYCRHCVLCENRTQVVFGEGNPDSPLMIIGEGPGATEDAMGRPFVGKAGQLLDRILEASGIRRSEIYITNIVKCRPPGNRTPTYEEMMACIPILREQFKIIRPRILVLLGSAATQAILDPNARITRVRGQWFERKGVKMIATYHPAFLLRNPASKKEAWADFQAIRDEYRQLLSSSADAPGA